MESNDKVVSENRKCESNNGRVPAAESKIFKVKRRNDEHDASGRLAHLYFARTEQTPVVPPRTPSFKASTKVSRRTQRIGPNRRGEASWREKRILGRK